MLKAMHALSPMAYWLGKSYLSEFDAKTCSTYMQLAARGMLGRLGVTTVVKGFPADAGTLMVGNHLSYLDIILLMGLVPTTFVAKSDLKRWPLIGATCKRIGVVFVDRSKATGRSHAIAEHFHKGERNLTIFPAGTTSLDRNIAWRSGAFHIAKAEKIPVQAFRLSYDPDRIAAYIDDDVFLPHINRIMALKKGIAAQITFDEPRLISDVEKDKETLRRWCQLPDAQ